MTTTATTHESTLADYARWDAMLSSAILDLTHALDPHHQGECWPDPIEWDGRPLDRQARDTLGLADDPYAAPEIREAGAALESALAEWQMLIDSRPYIVADAEVRP